MTTKTKKRYYLMVVILELAGGGTQFEEFMEEFDNDEQAEKAVKVLAKRLKKEFGAKSIEDAYAQYEPEEGTYGQA